MDYLTLHIFAVAYILLSFRGLERWKLDRPLVALGAAATLVVLGRIGAEEATQAIEWSTILLLLGVMGMGAVLVEAGVLQGLERWLLKRATPEKLLRSVSWGAGLSAAVLTNDAAVIFFTPVLVRLIQRSGLAPLPYLLALALAANTGSVATLVGNPQNMLVATHGDLAFGRYLLIVGPLAIALLALHDLWLQRLFRGRLLRAGAEPSLAGMSERQSDGDALAPPSRLRSGGVLAVLALTFVAWIAGAPMAWGAIAGFVAMLLISRASPERIWPRLDWGILVFFMGLFVLVAAVQRTGVMPWLEGWMVSMDDLSLGGTLALTGYFVMGSNLVSNVPFIALIAPAVHALSHPEFAWTLLAVASTLAGNMTLLGSAANVIVAEGSRAVGSFGFWEHLRVSLGLTLLSLAAASLYLFVIFRFVLW